MSFADEIQQDIQNIFLNVDEIAELKTYQGQEIPVVVVEESFNDEPDSPELRDHRVFRQSIVIGVDAQRVKRPLVYQEVEFDGATWTVWNVQFEAGIFLIALDRKRERTR